MNKKNKKTKKTKKKGGVASKKVVKKTENKLLAKKNIQKSKNQINPIKESSDDEFENEMTSFLENYGSLNNIFILNGDFYYRLNDSDNISLKKNKNELFNNIYILENTENEIYFYLKDLSNYRTNNAEEYELDMINLLGKNKTTCNIINFRLINGVYLLMENMDGDLNNFKDNNDNMLKIKISIEIIKILKCLNNIYFVFSDISLSNILYKYNDSVLTIKLGDIGGLCDMEYGNEDMRIQNNFGYQYINCNLLWQYKLFARMLGDLFNIHFNHDFKNFGVETKLSELLNNIYDNTLNHDQIILNLETILEWYNNPNNSNNSFEKKIVRIYPAKTPNPDKRSIDIDSSDLSDSD